MRLKKLMSLVLACAMALSLVTVASAADTKVYYAEDFSGYSDIETFKSSSHIAEGASDTNHTIGATTRANLIAKRTEINDSVIAFGTSGNITFGQDNFSFTTNDFGSKALQVNSMDHINGIVSNTSLVTNSWIGMGYGAFGIMPKESWNMVENPGETYVVSFELDATTTKHPGNWTHTSFQRPVGMLWKDASGNYSTSKAALQFGFSSDPVVARDPEEGEEPDNTVTNKIYTAPATWELYAVHQTWSSGQQLATLNSGDTHRIAFGYKYADQEEPMKIHAMDGAAWPNYANSLGNKSSADSAIDHTVFTTIDGMWFNYGTKAVMSLANIRMYTIKDNSFKAVIENNTDVPLNTKTIRVKFANPVSLSTWTKEGAVVKADGIPMAEGTYNIGDIETVVDGTEIYSYVDVTFTNLEEGTTYAIDFADAITNEIGTQLGETNSVATFATKMPDVKIMPLTVVGAESLVANGELQAVKATLINNTSAPKNVALIYAVYAGDKLADIVYINDSVEDTTDYEVGLKLASAGTVKAFAWDGMTSLKPYTGSVQLTVAAAQ